MDLIYIITIISSIIFPLLLGVNIWNIYTKNDDKIDTTAWYRNGIFNIAGAFPDIFMFLIKMGGLFGVLFFIEKLGPGKEGSDHTLYYSLSLTLLVTLIICYYLISTNFRSGPGSHIQASKNVPLSLQPSDISTVSDYLNIDGKNGLNLTSGIYVTYIFSVLIISLMIIERIDSKVKWDFKDFTVPIPIIGDLICGATMHNIMQTINIILFIYITLYVYYQFDLLKTDKKCP